MANRIMATPIIQQLLRLALEKAGSISVLSRSLKVQIGTVRLWYKANAQPGTLNLKKLENYVNGAPNEETGGH